jgi:hypothetical protein
MMRNTLLAAAALVALAGCTTPPTSAPGAVAKPPLTVSTEVKNLLWVGNSFFYYNNSMHGHVGQLLSAAGRTGMRATSATISGSGINWHDVEAHFKPGGVASYSFVGDNEVRFNTFDKPFDGVMMMDCSQCPVHPQLQPIFYEYAAKHSATVRKYGARTDPVHVLGLSGQAGDDAATGGGIHQGGQAEQRAGRACGPGLCRVHRQAARI